MEQEKDQEKEKETKGSWYERLEAFARHTSRGGIAGGSVLMFPFVLLASMIEGFVRIVRDVVQRLRPEDPFRLRRNGDTLLSKAVKLDLAAYTWLLGLSLTFELFAWGSMWSYIGETVGTGFWGVVLGIVLALLPFAFAFMVILLDRGILVMDDPTGSKRGRVIMARASMLFLLALITAVPVELRVFKPEIDTVVANAEKAQVDAIRKNAKVYETEMAEKQKASAAPMVTGQASDVVARRQTDRVAIEARLSAATKTTERVASGRGVSMRNQSTALAAAQKRESDTRAELVAFDAETERMRSEAAGAGVDEIARRDTALEEKLHAVEVMSSEDLAAAYGGEYIQANGFLARYRILLTLVEEDDKNQMIVWGCRLVMVIFGLCVLFVKFVMTSQETTAYYSLRAQALSGNADVIRVFIARALANSKDEEAIGVLRAVARDNADAKVALEKLGYGANVETGGWTSEVMGLHAQAQAAQEKLHAALAQFRTTFRELCERRQGTPPAALSRNRLVAEAEAAWRNGVEPSISELTTVEGQFDRVGAQRRQWSSEFEQPDPRSDRRRLWKLSDAELIEQFGWTTPDYEEFTSAPNA